MSPAPGDAETDPRFPSGKWVGFWTQKVLLPGKHRQELVLAFAKGEMGGEGRDRVGAFHIRGFYSIEDGKCRWTKRYVGLHDVFYQGSMRAKEFGAPGKSFRVKLLLVRGADSTSGPKEWAIRPSRH